ncbi:hypothetical protein [Actinomadura sp. SCN-SB]|uniref:hypothetical protein n=1 Tax=Actinomadura sp. SCN-SB TaxID=3373092 RepID=UPI003750E5CF
MGLVGAEIAKRVDVLATGIHAGIIVEELNDRDLSYTPPAGQPMGRATARRPSLDESGSRPPLTKCRGSGPPRWIGEVRTSATSYV